jgi:hypothetical protein
VRIRAIHGDAMPESAVALPPPPAPPPARAPGQNQGRPPGNRTCDVPGCGKKHKCAGLCGIHYNVLGRRLGNSRRCATSMPLAERIALATSPNPQAVAMAKRKRGESDALRGVRTELDAYAPGHGTLAERVRALGREVVTLRREVATLRRTLADLQTEADRLSDRAQVYLSTAELAGLDIPVMENR